MLNRNSRYLLDKKKELGVAEFFEWLSPECVVDPIKEQERDLAVFLGKARSSMKRDKFTKCYSAILLKNVYYHALFNEAMDHKNHVFNFIQRNCVDNIFTI